MPNIIISRRMAGHRAKATPYGNAWSAQVQANGGAQPSRNSVNTVDTLMSGLASNGLTSSIITMNLYAPDSLIAASTPQIAAGTQPWTRTNFLLSDLTVNGLQADGGKYFDPGVIPDTSAMTSTSQCYFFYAYNTNTNGTGTEIGSFDGSTDNAFVSNFSSAGLQCFSDLNGAGCRLTVATPGNGFYLASRTASNSNNIYFANSGTAWSSIASNATASSALIHTGLLVFAFNKNGAPSQGCNSLLSCSGIATGLTSGQGQALYNLIQAARVSFGGGFR